MTVRASEEKDGQEKQEILQATSPRSKPSSLVSRPTAEVALAVETAKEKQWT